MQDGASISGDDASAWLRERCKDEPETKVDISWRDQKPDPVAYRRLLELLFSPRADSPSA